MNHVLMAEQTERIDREIQELSERLSKYHPPTLQDETLSAGHRSRKCTWLCARLSKPEQRLQCIQQCVRPVVDVEKLKDEFPYDWQQLMQNPALYSALLRHQQANCNEMIPDSPVEIEIIVDLYSMPVASVALPEESWSRSLALISGHQDKRQQLQDRWQRRKSHFPAHSWHELERKVKRHGHGKFHLVEETKNGSGH